MKAVENWEIIFGKVFNAQSLIQMKIIKKVKPSNRAFCIRKTNLVYLEDFPIISKLDNEEFMKEYIPQTKTEGAFINPDQITDAPPNLYKRSHKRSCQAEVDQEVIKESPDKLTFKRKLTLEEEVDEMVNLIPIKSPPKKSKKASMYSSSETASHKNFKKRKTLKLASKPWW